MPQEKPKINQNNKKMAELTEEQKAALAAEEAKKAAEEAKKSAPKKQKYADLPPSATIVYEVTVRNTEIEDGDVKVTGVTQKKCATKAFWEKLEKYPKGHSKEGQARDINEGLKNPKLIGYMEGDKEIKF